MENYLEIKIESGEDDAPEKAKIVMELPSVQYNLQLKALKQEEDSLSEGVFERKQLQLKGEGYPNCGTENVNNANDGSEVMEKQNLKTEIDRFNGSMNEMHHTHSHADDNKCLSPIKTEKLDVGIKAIDYTDHGTENVKNSNDDCEVQKQDDLNNETSMDNDIFGGDTSQSSDDFEVPSMSKISNKQKYRPKNRPSRKIGLTWSEEKETSLILAVQRQRPLWDCSVPEYKLTHAKLDCWQVVAQELNMAENWSEARKKWNSMRSNFKTFLGKRRSKNSGQGVDELKNVKYPHFKEMLFIETAETENSTPSSTTLDMGNAKTDGLRLDNLSQAVNEEMSPIPPTVGLIRKRSASRTPIRTPSPTLRLLDVKKIAAEVLANFQNQNREPADRFTAIGEVFADHLRNLNANDAINLESRLFKVLYDFLGSRTSSGASSTVTMLGQNGFKITDPQILKSIAVVSTPTDLDDGK